MRTLLDWLNDRTDYRTLLAHWRGRMLSEGPSWVYSSAVCLLWLLVVQLATGFLMMATYSPSTATAWASVHFIENAPGGKIIRGVHYFAAQGVIILFALHLIRILLTGAFRAPRELVWITGLLLLPLILIWAITGNPLSNSQKGISQIDVEGHIIGSTPIVGPVLQRILIGGDQPGHLTLTHLYFLHVAFLPVIVLGLLTIHLWQVYRHGTSVQRDSLPGVQSVPYWPYQSVRNMIVTAMVLGGIVLLAWREGAPLEAPADSTIAHAPRPEWYFLSLFELRRHFSGDWEFVATMVLPLAAFGLLLAIPLIDGACSRRWSLAWRSLIVLAGAVAWVGLTYAALSRDWRDEDYLASRRNLERLSDRARLLADRTGVPPEGAQALLRNDPQTQGPLLFARHCASCHTHLDAQGQGIAAEKPAAPNLYGFASRTWLVGMLDAERIRRPEYFGKTELADGEMAGALQSLFDEAESEEQRRQLRDDLTAVAGALSAEARLPPPEGAEPVHTEALQAGAELLAGRLGCTDCHRFHDQGELGSAPDLTGYGSRDWIIGMMSNPAHPRFYGGNEKDGMPAFAAEPDHPDRNLLTPRELMLLADWLRRDWVEP